MTMDGGRLNSNEFFAGWLRPFSSGMRAEAAMANQGSRATPVVRREEENRNTKFPVLSTVSNLLRVSGWLVVVAAVLYAVFAGIIEPMLPRHTFGYEDFMQLIAGMGWQGLASAGRL